MSDDDDRAPDITINIHKGANGYGIYFTQKPDGIFVTKIDANSEAARAGVMVKDELYSVQDLDKVHPPSAPGSEIIVKADNYHSSLEIVRQMKYCRLAFISHSAMAFADN